MALQVCGLSTWLIFTTTVHCEPAQDMTSADSSMRQHYDAAFRLQGQGHSTEADFQHKLFLAAALHRIANGRANIGEYGEASPMYEQAVQFTPGDFTLRLEYAEAALDAEDAASAKRVAEDALKLLHGTADPRESRALHVLATALWAVGERKQAIAEYKAAAAIHPDFENLYALGTRYLSLADKENATKIFAEILVKLGDTATIRMQLGRAFAIDGYFPEAIQEFKKAIARSEKLPGLHYSLGAAYMQRSGAASFPEAEAEFHKELLIQPNDPFSYPQLGRIALTRHNYKQAGAYLARANELGPGNPDTHLLLAELYGETGKPLDEEIALRSAIAETSDPSRNHYEIQRAHYQLGHLLVQRGNTDEGRREIQISAELLTQSRLQDESNLNSKSMLRVLSPRTRPIKPADESKEKRLEAEIGPAIASSYNSLGVHAAIAAHYVEAAAYFKRASSWGPNLDGVNNNWGHAAFEAREYDQAISPLIRSLEIHPEDFETRLMLGLAVASWIEETYAECLRGTLITTDSSMTSPDP
jgi:tetratricopeptide (TPR) repeat protein